MGGFELRTGAGERVEALAGRTKCLALLAYLAVEAPDGRVLRDEVATLLWSGRADERARASLRSALSQIRQATDLVLVAGEGTSSLGLVRDHVRADVTAFQRALEGGDAERALELYGGDFLAGVHMEGARGFQRWADRQRGRLRQQAYEAALSVGTSARGIGDLAAAEVAFRRALDLGPLREEAAGNLIQTLADRGRSADAVQLYETFRERREEELEMAPSEELQERVKELKRAPPSASTAGAETPTGSEGPPVEDEGSSGHGREGSIPSRSRRLAGDRTSRWSRFRRRTLIGVVVGLGLLGAAGAAVWHLVAGGGGESAEIVEETVAVLPFEVSGSGAETWRDGMVTLLNTNLDGAAGLRAIADRTVFAAWQESERAGEGASTGQALGVARRVGAEYAVVGSAVQVAGELRFMAEIHETATGDRLGQAVVRDAPDRVISLTDRLTRRILEILLEETGDGLPSVDLAAVTTQSLPALLSFLDGERLLRAGEHEAAIEHFEAAVEADSTFALAYARLGLSRWWTRTTAGTEEERSAWRRALEFGEQLPRRQRRLVRALHLSRVESRSEMAADSLRHLTRDYPDDPTLWYNFGEVLFHGLVPRGWPEAEHAFRRAVALDPDHTLYYGHHTQLAIAVRRDSAMASERIAAIPRQEWRELYRIPLDLAFGDTAARRDALARLDTISVSDAWETGIRHPLMHPAEREAYGTLLERLQMREGSEELVEAFQIANRLVANSFLRGQVREGITRLESYNLPPRVRTCVLAHAMSEGVPVPDSVAAHHLEPAQLGEDASRHQLLCAAIYLIDHGRGEEADGLIAGVQETAAVRDSVPPDLRSSLDEVVGYRAWRSGELEKAVRRLSGTPGANTWFLQTGRLWRGDLYRQLGRLKTAEGWYLAAWTHPVAHERLGQLYEEMDRPDEAAAAYRRFIAAWGDADPELQPRVEAARERLEQLTASEAEPDE